MSFAVRKAEPEDLSVIVRLIHELAVGQHVAPSAICVTQQALHNDGWSDQPRVRLLVAASNDAEPVGAAMLYNTYSTWRGPMTYLECIAVDAARRGCGAGSALLRHVALEAHARGMCRLAWNVLRSDAALIAHCERIGAQLLGEWIPVFFERVAMPAFINAPLSESEKGMTLRVRPADAVDAVHIMRLIKDLAVFEREPLENITVTEEVLIRDGFGQHPMFECLLCETEIDCRVEVVGLAFYFHTYSAFRGRAIHLEDLVVSPTFRGRGAGTKLLRALTEIAFAQGCQRLGWQVLDWNTPAIKFYEKIGAQLQPQFLPMRFDEARLEAYVASIQSSK